MTTDHQRYEQILDRYKYACVVLSEALQAMQDRIADRHAGHGFCVFRFTLPKPGKYNLGTKVTSFLPKIEEYELSERKKMDDPKARPQPPKNKRVSRPKTYDKKGKKIGLKDTNKETPSGNEPVKGEKDSSQPPQPSKNTEVSQPKTDDKKEKMGLKDTKETPSGNEPVEGEKDSTQLPQKTSRPIKAAVKRRIISSNLQKTSEPKINPSSGP